MTKLTITNDKMWWSVEIFLRRKKNRLESEKQK
jgi:hypothetical protein